MMMTFGMKNKDDAQAVCNEGDHEMRCFEEKACEESEEEQEDMVLSARNN